MIPAPPQAATTVLDRLVEYLRVKDIATDGEERPAAILWTDPKGEWRPVIELMQTRVEELLVLGDYAPIARTGPAIWIRCLVDGALDEPALPADRAPLVYLPGVARQELRAGEECRKDYRPLVELMFRGTLWLQHNGSDWGVTTFLTSPKTLALDIARDNATTEALLRALPEVAVTPVAQLAGRRLEADDLDRMLSGDVVRDLLRWMGDPTGTKARLGENGWGAFCNRCRDELDFDLEVEADVTAGERLGEGKGAWAKVWERFVESPTSYGDLAGLLRRSRPAGSLAFDRDRWPDLNDQDEASVRAALGGLQGLSHGEACDVIADLEKRHGERRNAVWAKVGLSPMAQVLAPLSQLAGAARLAVGGASPEEISVAYRDRGWQADAAAWEALATTPTTDESLVSSAVRHLLLPWLEDSARAFQKAAERTPLPGRGQQPLVEAGEDVCLLFADGLRYDLGQRLSERLEGRGYRVTLGHRWAAVPSVTATSKPAVTPVANAVAGEMLGEDFAPKFRATGKAATSQELRAAMQERGYQVLDLSKMDWPESQPARGWAEAGEVDTLGHKLEARLARQLDEELGRLVERIAALLDAGWQAVRVVTDHGWLLLPGGLPKVDLPKHLTESRWARCAVIAGEATPDVNRAAWHWNASQSFAAAPGIACFNTSPSYAHGGLSIQECLIPDLFVERSGETTVAATITSVTWRGMRCFVEAVVKGAGVTADLRVERPTGPSAVATVKPVEEDGSVSLVVVDDEYEQAELVLVLLDAGDNILAQKQTRVGADS